MDEFKQWYKNIPMDKKRIAYVISGVIAGIFNIFLIPVLVIVYFEVIDKD